MSDHLNNLIDDFNDRSFIYTDLCSSSSSYYSKCKYIFSIPVILVSSILSILNSNIVDEKQMKLLNISCNVLIALLMSLTNLFKFAEKQQSFKIWSAKFTELNHSLQTQISLEESISKEYILNFIEKYDNIVSSMDFEIPEHIKKKIHDKYKTKKTLPIIINGVEKSPENRIRIRLTTLT